MKAYQNGVELILQCLPVLEVLVEKHKSGKQIERDNNQLMNEEKMVEEFNVKQDDDEENKLVSLLEQRFQYILRSLTKLCISKSNTTNNKKEYVELNYKLFISSIYFFFYVYLIVFVYSFLDLRILQTCIKWHIVVHCVLVIIVIWICLKMLFQLCKRLDRNFMKFKMFIKN